VEALLRRVPFPERGRGISGGDDADRWVPPVSEGKRERGYRFGIWLGGLRAASGVGPDRFPGVQFYFFLFSFLLFFFCFLYFFQTLFKFDPNRSKPTLQSF
jgi:hypothetical protein